MLTDTWITDCAGACIAECYQPGFSLHYVYRTKMQGEALWSLQEMPSNMQFLTCHTVIQIQLDFTAVIFIALLKASRLSECWSRLSRYSGKIATQRIEAGSFVVKRAHRLTTATLSNGTA